MTAEIGDYLVVTEEKPIRRRISVARGKERLARMDLATFSETECPLSSGWGVGPYNGPRVKRLLTGPPRMEGLPACPGLPGEVRGARAGSR